MCPNPNGNNDPAGIEGEVDPHLHELDKKIDALAEKAIPPKGQDRFTKCRFSWSTLAQLGEGRTYVTAFGQT